MYAQLLTSHVLITLRVDRTWRDHGSPIMSGPFAMLIQMGTLEGTKHKPWTWILGAPLVTLKEAGVHFDPDVRGLKAIQGDAESGSALEVREFYCSHKEFKGCCVCWIYETALMHHSCLPLSS